MYDGVINIYKEKGFTSFDVVAKLRGILKQKKIGHTGTLDPDAEGVLVVCLGKATKLCDILTDKNKSYEAVFRLGITTDTEDSSGTVLSQKDVCVTEEQVKDVIQSFVGEYQQIPPMYSAIKVNGRKLYELARQGIEIERKPRPVMIHDIEILSIQLPVVKIAVNCSKGTYIRSLCRDIGEQLGCGAVLEHLLRTSVNAQETGFVFTTQDALRLLDVESLVSQGMLDSHIISIDRLFPRYPKYTVNKNGNARLMNGNLLSLHDLEGEVSVQEDGTPGLIYDPDGIFRAIYRYQSEQKMFKADKMFL